MGACQSNANKPGRARHAPISRSFKHKPMQKWTENDVYSWLSTTMDGKLSSLAPIFKKHKINGKKLIHLTKHELRAMNISESLLERVLLLRNTQLQRENQPQTAVAEPGTDHGKTTHGVLRATSPAGGIQTIQSPIDRKPLQPALSVDAVQDSLCAERTKQKLHVSRQAPLDTDIIQEMEQVAEESATDIIHPDPDGLLVYTHNTSGDNQNSSTGGTANGQSAQQQSGQHNQGGHSGGVRRSGGDQRPHGSGTGGSGNGGNGGRRGGSGGDNRKNNDWSRPMAVDSDEEEEDEEDEKEEVEYSHSHSSLNPHASSFLEPIDEGAEDRDIVHCSEHAYDELNSLMAELASYTKHSKQVRVEVVEEKLRAMQRLISKSPTMMSTASAHTAITFNTPQSMVTNGSSNKRKKKKKGRHAHGQMGGGEHLSYEPVPQQRGKTNFQIPRQVTEEKLIAMAMELEGLSNCYEYVEKSIAMQMYDGQQFNNGEVCIIHLDLHSKEKEKEALYLMARCIVDTKKARDHKWKVDNKVYLAREIVDQSMVPMSSRNCANYSKLLHNVEHIREALQNAKSLIVATKWHKLPVFNKKSNKLRVTVSITKTEFMRKVTAAFEQHSDAQHALIPIVMFNNGKKPKYEIHFVEVLEMKDEEVGVAQPVAISYHYNAHSKKHASKVTVSGIHIDGEQLAKQHALAVPAHMANCECLRALQASTTTHFYIGNPDDDANKIKSMSKLIEQHKQQIAAMKLRMDHEAFMQAQNVPAPSVTPSLTSCSQESSFMSSNSNYDALQEEEHVHHDLLIEQAYHTPNNSNHHKNCNNSSLFSSNSPPFHIDTH
eukprot:CAMPEP_0197032718 /NCGR_PEP_ID=MMETSP1384-20130603/11317_1 /TAXON_ID=29189 /ORGANISM="Ammonia sp." /LENGTH=827 /DNA_ID=CAMNT_0042462417 /DNA_START=8 /DNA_END=2491 /DNA_ORIENTATION=+